MPPKGGIGVFFPCMSVLKVEKSTVQLPAVIAVVDHEPCLAAVDADVFAGEEAGLVGGQEQHHVGNVHRVAHPSGRLLDGVGAGVDGPGGVDPAPDRR